MYGYAENLCAERREAPGADLMSALLAAELDGEQLSQLDLNLFFLLLHNAGSETTRNLVTGGVIALLENPDQLELLRAEPARIPVAIEELLRWVTPVTHFARTVTNETEVAGQQVLPGEQVLLWYTSANRDEDAFDGPGPARRHARPQPARRVRLRRPALLPRRPPGPAGGDLPVRGADRSATQARDRRPGAAPAVALHQRGETPAAAVVTLAR